VRNIFFVLLLISHVSLGQESAESPEPGLPSQEASFSGPSKSWYSGLGVAAVVLGTFPEFNYSQGSDFVRMHPDAGSLGIDLTYRGHALELSFPQLTQDATAKATSVDYSYGFARFYFRLFRAGAEGMSVTIKDEPDGEILSRHDRPDIKARSQGFDVFYAFSSNPDFALLTTRSKLDRWKTRPDNNDFALGISYQDHVWNGNRSFDGDGPVKGLSRRSVSANIGYFGTTIGTFILGGVYSLLGPAVVFQEKTNEDGSKVSSTKVGINFSGTLNSVFYWKLESGEEPLTFLTGMKVDLATLILFGEKFHVLNMGGAFFAGLSY